MPGGHPREWGQVIDRSVFEPLYGEHLDPRDPAGKTTLGRAAQRFTPEQAIFEDLVAAEPHASPARLAELRTLAKAQARHAVPFWDVTVSVSKSITLFYRSEERRVGKECRARRPPDQQKQNPKLHYDSLLQNCI